MHGIVDRNAQRDAGGHHGADIDHDSRPRHEAENNDDREEVRNHRDTRLRNTPQVEGKDDRNDEERRDDASDQPVDERVLRLVNERNHAGEFRRNACGEDDIVAVRARIAGDLLPVRFRLEIGTDPEKERIVGLEIRVVGLLFQKAAQHVLRRGDVAQAGIGKIVVFIGFGMKDIRHDLFGRLAEHRLYNLFDLVDQVGIVHIFFEGPDTDTHTPQLDSPFLLPEPAGAVKLARFGGGDDRAERFSRGDFIEDPVQIGDPGLFEFGLLLFEEGAKPQRVEEPLLGFLVILDIGAVRGVLDRADIRLVDRLGRIKAFLRRVGAEEGLALLVGKRSPEQVPLLGVSLAQRGKFPLRHFEDFRNRGVPLHG